MPASISGAARSTLQPDGKDGLGPRLGPTRRELPQVPHGRSLMTASRALGSRIVPYLLFHEPARIGQRGVRPAALAARARLERGGGLRLVVQRPVGPAHAVGV